MDATEPGWPFGELPTLSDLYALVEGVEGVDYVERLTVQYDTSEPNATVTVTEGEEPPSVSPDALIHSGSHDVTVRLDTDDEDDSGSGGS
jgi:hypothetical protein